MVGSWMVFVVSAAVIVYAGAKLSKYGDRIADLTGLGGLWIGMSFLHSSSEPTQQQLKSS